MKHLCMAAMCLAGIIGALPAGACTAQEEQQKVLRIMADMSRQEEKQAEVVQRRFEEALDRALQRPVDPQHAIDEFCHELDGLLAELAHPMSPGRDTPEH